MRPPGWNSLGSMPVPGLFLVRWPGSKISPELLGKGALGEHLRQLVVNERMLAFQRELSPQVERALRTPCARGTIVCPHTGQSDSEQKP